MPTSKPKPYWHVPQKVSLYLGDCTEIMEDMPSSSVDLIFADPPFNQGIKYGNGFNDRKEFSEYLQWTGRWLAQCKQILKPNGSIYVAIGSRMQAYLMVLMEQAGFHWRNTIMWHYTFGPRQLKKWTPSWCAIHYFVCDMNNYTWNPSAVFVPSARQRKYNDSRASPEGKVPDDTWVLDPADYKGQCFLEDHDAWIHSRLCGTFKERTPHPCQMPEALLDRVIRASSDANDLVLDPFMGSGTTGASALRLGRRVVGIEQNEQWIQEVQVSRLRKIVEAGT